MELCIYDLCVTSMLMIIVTEYVIDYNEILDLFSIIYFSCVCIHTLQQIIKKNEIHKDGGSIDNGRPRGLEGCFSFYISDVLLLIYTI